MVDVQLSSTGGLPPPEEMDAGTAVVAGVSRGKQCNFVWIEAGVFMIQLESMQSRLLCQGASNFESYPFAGFYNRGDARAGAQGEEDVDARWPTVIVDMWHYEDPQGDSHGPYSMVSLQRWSGNGFFAEDFRVWRTDETKEQAILLTDAMLSLCVTW